MVLKIERTTRDIWGTLDYHNRKMSGPEGILSGEALKEYEREGNTGHVLATRNVPENSTLENEFRRLRFLNLRKAHGKPLENEGFHMSINPDWDFDRRLSEEEAVRYMDELMLRLGYGEVPYRMFKHTDIERTHYHIVATRIGPDGKKISDSFENERCKRIAEQLAKEFGYTLGKGDRNTREEEENEGEREEREERGAQTPAPEAGGSPWKDPEEKDGRKDGEKDRKGSEKEREAKAFIPPFDIRRGEPLSDSVRVFHAEAMKWNFSTVEQYAMIMRWRYNVETELYDEDFVFSGLDDKGEKATKPVTEKELDLTVGQDVREKVSSTKMSARKAQRARLEREVRTAAENAASLREMRVALSKKGIYAVIHWTRDGQPFGVTWLDRATRCAWKASETDVTLEWLKGRMEENGWKASRHARHEKPAKAENGKTAAPKEASRTAARHTGTRDFDRLMDKWKREMERGPRDGAVGGTRRSNADAAHNRDHTLDDPNDIII